MVTPRRGGLLRDHRGLWGASLGKALCGFRVVTEHGARPRFTRALLRAMVFVLPPWFASGLVLSIAGLVYTQRPSGLITVIVVEIVVRALLFVPARRENGFAGVHEWVSHTRTVLKFPVQTRQVVQSVPVGIEVAASPRSVGPYRLVDTLPLQPNAGAALGYDERLRRAVWLRFPGVDADPVPLARRMLRRPARPRWLAGQRAGGLAWDAYEHVPGQPFDPLVTRAQPWGTVRGWLGDLAEEVQAGLADGSLPALELDRVWIGDDGRARLLDWPAPNGGSDSASSRRQSGRSIYRRLNVSCVALRCRPSKGIARRQRHRTVPLPLPAADCLAKLGEQRFTTSEDMLTALMSAARGPAAISRTKRAAHLSLCAIPTIFMLIFGSVAVYIRLFVDPRQDAARPDLVELAACLDRLAALENRGVPSTNTQYRALEVYIAGRHRDLISNPSTWSALTSRAAATLQRATRACRTGHRDPTQPPES